MLKRIIKIVSILIITLLAIVGYLFDFKNKSGVVTLWGMIAIIATGILMLIAIILEIIDYREKVNQEKLEKLKEEAQKKLLAEIQDNITSTNYSLVPFRLFYTLRHTTSETEIEKYFNNLQGYKSIKKNEFLKLTGTFRLGEIYYNPEEEEPKESHCTLKSIELIEEAKMIALNSGETILKIPSDFIIEIYTNGLNDEPEITLEANYGAASKAGAIKELRLYDNWIYQDGVIVNWQIRTKKQKVYGVRDLRNATIKIIADIWNNDKIIDEYSPMFTNIHFYFGENPTTFMFFTKENLQKNLKTYRRNPLEEFLKLEGELANEMFKTLAIDLNIYIDDEIFNNQIRQYT